MIVHIDTSALVDALTGPRRSLETLISLTDQGHRLALSTIVLYEWLRGPRTKADLSAQEALLPSEHAIGFGPAEAALAARLYKQVARPRGREVDLAVAAGRGRNRAWCRHLDAQLGRLSRHPRVASGVIVKPRNTGSGSRSLLFGFHNDPCARNGLSRAR